MVMMLVVMLSRMTMVPGGDVGHDDDGDGNVVHGGDGDGDVGHGGDARVLIEGWAEHED